MVEAVRWSITEGAVLQAIGRGRGVRRTAARPLVVTLLGELALPLTVASIEEWEEAQPDRLTVAAAEAALSETALPLAPHDLAMARSDLFPSAKAVERFFERADNTPQGLISNIYKRLGGIIPARYRKVGARGAASHALVPITSPRQALEAIVWPLSFFEVALPAAATENEFLGRIVEPHLAGLWTVQGRDCRLIIASDSGGDAALWVPNSGPNADVPENLVLPMLLAPWPASGLPQAVPQNPDLPPLPEPFAGWRMEPRRRNALTELLV
jgi:hypothetical protein